jgi:hypothetical protein
MANLHVQPKRRSNAWIWLLVIVLIIAAAVYYYFNYYKNGITPGSDKALRESPSLQLNLSQLLLKNSDTQMFVY